MKTLVTGATGFIGSHLLAAMTQHQRPIRILIHKHPLAGTETGEIVKGDLGAGEGLAEALEGCDTVFHLAAALGSGIPDKRDFFRVNVTGTRNLLEAAARAGVKRLIHFSSAGVIGRVKDPDIADENYPQVPRSRYDRTKQEGEAAALEYAGRLHVSVIRPGWVYGPGDRRTLKLIRAIAQDKFYLVTGAKTRQTPLYIDDLIQGALLAEKNGKSGEIYHLAGPETLTVSQITDTIAEATGTRIKKLPIPRFFLIPAAWKMDLVFRMFGKEAPLTPGKLSFFTCPKPLDYHKAAAELGYSPATDFLTGMKQTVAWYRKNDWL